MMTQVDLDVLDGQLRITFPFGFASTHSLIIIPHSEKKYIKLLPSKKEKKKKRFRILLQKCCCCVRECELQKKRLQEGLADRAVVWGQPSADKGGEGGGGGVQKFEVKYGRLHKDYFELGGVVGGGSSKKDFFSKFFPPLRWWLLEIHLTRLIRMSPSAASPHITLLSSGWAFEWPRAFFSCYSRRWKKKVVRTKLIDK